MRTPTSIILNVFLSLMNQVLVKSWKKASKIVPAFLSCSFSLLFDYIELS